jgi:predicted MPP superfamily phosphohydrolase
MPAGEIAGLILFVAIVVAVYATASFVIADAARRRIKKLPPLPRKRAIARRVNLVMAAFGTICVAYGHFIEPFWPEVTEVNIPSTKLSDGESVRIVHISDLHCDPSPRLEPRLPDLIAQQRPDAIVFTGDCINSIEALPIFKQCMREIARVAPTFGVQGNWDIWRPDADLFGDTGVVELRGQVEEVTVRGTTIRFAGAAARAGDEIESALAALRTSSDAFTVFLYHFPDVIEAAAASRVDLCCVGHTHGGQVALPFYGAVITRSKLGKKFEAGRYRVNDTWLYVNRGIGMEGKSSPRVRFCARPEVTVLQIGRGEAKSKDDSDH